MPRNAPRGGPETRERIRSASHVLFHERGFDAVTVGEVAAAAGVSQVTVFKHFPRKEDLFLDRSADAETLLVEAVRNRRNSSGAVAGLRAALVQLAEHRAPLSGLAAGSEDFFRIVMRSPALIARARELGGGLQTLLTKQLSGAGVEPDDAALIAALVIAGYGAVLVGTAQRILAGDDRDEVAADHQHRLAQLFDTLDSGIRS